MFEEYFDQVQSAKKMDEKFEDFQTLLEAIWDEGVTTDEIYRIKIEKEGQKEGLIVVSTGSTEEMKATHNFPQTEDEQPKRPKGRPRSKLDCSVNDLFLHLCSFVSSQISKIISST